MGVEIESTYDYGHGKKFLTGVFLASIFNRKSSLLLLCFLIVMVVSTEALAFPSLYIPLGRWQSKSDGLPCAGSTCFHSF